MRVLITGCGYVGLRLGTELIARGHEVDGMRRTAEGIHEVARHNIHPIQADITDPGSLRAIKPEYDWIVNTVSSSRGGVEDYRSAYLEGNKNLFEWFMQSPPRLFYFTSSTSVYGQTGGEWVDENSAAEGASATSSVLVETERFLAAKSATILRVGGIYGPGRGHLFHQYVKGEAVLRGDGSNFLNMAHLDDIVGAIAYLLERNVSKRLLNIVDNEPVTQIEFLRWLASQLNGEVPSGAPPDANRKRGLTNKRVSNKRLLESGYQFKFPTYREGYAGMVQAELEKRHSAGMT